MWLSRLRRLVSGNSRTSQGKHSRHRRGIKPRLDYLEDRIVLSTISVNAGDVPGLIAAINQANTDSNSGVNDTIVLNANSQTTSVYTISAANNQTNGANALPVITAKNLVIQGNNSTITRSSTSGTAAFRLFDVAAGAGLTLQKLTLSNGLASGTTVQGGGLYNGGNVAMTTVALTGDIARGGAGQNAQGGGIYSLNGTLTLKNVTLNFDQAYGGSNGGSAQGAGLYLSGGKANLTNCHVSINTLSGGSGAAGGNAQGGGIFANAATLTLTGGTVSSNTINGLGGGAGAKGTAQNPNGGNGGNADGGGVFATQSTVTIQGGATVNANTVRAGTAGNGFTGSQGKNGGQGGTGGLAQGGGVYVNGGQLTITGTGTAVTNNTATGGHGGQGGTGGKAALLALAGAIGGNGGAGGEADGGGVYALAAPVTINGGAVVNNNTLTGGAGGGGGIGGAGASGNQNGGAGGAGGTGGLAQGGGLFASGSNLAVALGNSTTTATINANTATGGAAGNGGSGGAKIGTGVGGAGGMAGAGGSGTGGGATIFGDNLTLTNAIFSGDDVFGGNAGRGGTGKSGGAGAAGGMGGSAQGGGLFVSGNSTTTTILNSTIYSNEAAAKRGGTGAAGGAGGNGGTGGNSQGGGLYVVSSNVSALNSTFADNIAIAGTEGVNAANSPSGNGGAGQGAGIYAATGSLTLTNDTIAWNFLKAFTDRNAQPGQGAGIYNASNNTLKLENTIIAKDELFSTSTNLSSITLSDLFGNAASSDHDFVGDGAGSNLINGTNGDQVGSDTSPLDPQFLPPVTTSPTTFGLSGQVPGSYGGLTPTLPLNWTSAAINGGDPGAATTIASAEGVAASSATDQRGFARVLDGTIDIGATETQLSVDGSATATVQPGSNITYTLTVANGETTAIGVTLSDPLPANTTFVSISPAPAGWTVTTPTSGQSGTITASTNSTTPLAANSSVTFTIVVQVSSSAQSGSIIANTATLSTAGVTPTFSRSATFDTTVAGSTTTDITNKIGIRVLPVHPDPDSGPNAFEQKVMLVNNSGTTLTGPIALVLTGLPAGVTLTNATGTFNGSPYIDIVPAGGSWQPGQRNFLMPRLKFTNTGSSPITWTAEVIQGI